MGAAIYRLINRHGRGYWADEVIKLNIWPNPDGKYLIKGGGRKVWKKFGLRKEHRRLQGIIHGKRCGTTENKACSLAAKRARGCLRCRNGAIEYAWKVGLKLDLNRLRRKGLDGPSKPHPVAMRRRARQPQNSGRHKPFR